MASEMPSMNNSPSGHDSDGDFDPSAEMLVNDFDDEHTMEEEEAIDEEENFDEIDDLEKEGEMPLEELLAMYGYQAGGPANEVEKPAEMSTPEVESSEPDGQVVNENNDQPEKVEEEQVTSQTSNTVNPEESRTTAASSSWSLPGSAVLNTDHGLAKMLDDDSDWDDEDDGDYEEGDEDPEENEGDWRRSIQIGPDYQAEIPESLSEYDDVPAYENEDRLIWEPTRLPEEEVESYLKIVKTSSADFGLPSDEEIQPVTGLNSMPALTSLPTDVSIRDDEQALFILQQAGHQTDEALRRRGIQSGVKTTLFETMTPWSEEECREFEEGLREFGKDFHSIQKNKVPTRTVREVVHFYYLWKKTERHDQFVSVFRLEKKKYNLHPFVTDYMDRFAEEQEAMLLSSSSPGNPQVTTSMASSSSNVNPAKQLTQFHVQHSMFPSSYSQGSTVSRNPQVTTAQADTSSNGNNNNFNRTTIVTSTSGEVVTTNSPTCPYTNGHSKNAVTAQFDVPTAKSAVVNLPIVESSGTPDLLQPPGTVVPGHSPPANLSVKSADSINCK